MPGIQVQQNLPHYAVFLQKTWLSEQDLSYLSTISSTHYGQGTSSFDLTEKIVSGKPCGGTAILWHKSLKATVVSDFDHSIMRLTVQLSDALLSVVNVYLLYCCDGNNELFLDYLGKLGNIIDGLPCTNFCIVGGFNVGPSNRFGDVLDTFCDDYDILVFDYEILPNETYTYISDSHSSCSWIDRCVSTKAAHASISHIEVLHNFILSDHRPLMVVFKCSHLPRFTAEDTKLCAPQLKWKNASEREITAYHDHTKPLLSNVTLPLGLLSCSTTDCCDRSHYLEIDRYYTGIIDVLTCVF